MPCSFGPGLGVGIIAEGYVQPQAGFVTTALAGAGSYLVYFKGVNFRFPWVKRLIFEPDFELGRYNDVQTCTGTDNPGFPGQRAGSNNSDRNNSVEADVSDHWVDLTGILYTLEYRCLLDWNPLRNITWKGRLQVDWFEVVGFGKLGRVAPSWDLGTFHKSMKYDGGPEGYATQMFVGHPFPFY